MKEQLAIVIPAYKVDFFDQTLASIAGQTCKDFTVYIGDDASPSDLYSITCKYENQLKIVYKRFAANLGGADLVAHWNRCLDMTGEEEWLWLFSDDDIMGKNCVAAFYNYIQTHAEGELLHFNVEVIDGSNAGMFLSNPFPDLLDASAFFANRVKVKLNSYAVEYIFRKELYLKKGKFQHFDLAWSSDDATWIKFSMDKGIRTIKGATVKWRYSQSNISSMLGDKKILTRKLNAGVAYLAWADQFFTQNHLTDPTDSFTKFKSVFITLIKNSSLSLTDKYRFALFYLKRSGYKNIRLLSICYLTLALIKKKLANNKYSF